MEAPARKRKKPVSVVGWRMSGKRPCVQDEPIWLLEILSEDCLRKVLWWIPTYTDLVYFASAHPEILAVVRKEYARWLNKPELAPWPCHYPEVALDWEVVLGIQTMWYGRWTHEMAVTRRRIWEAIELHGLDREDAGVAAALSKNINWDRARREVLAYLSGYVGVTMDEDVALAVATVKDCYLTLLWLSQQCVRRGVRDFAMDKPVIKVLVKHNQGPTLTAFNDKLYVGPRMPKKRRNVAKIIGRYAAMYGQWDVWNLLSLRDGDAGMAARWAAQYGHTTFLDKILHHVTNGHLYVIVETEAVIAAIYKQTHVLEWYLRLLEDRPLLFHSPGALQVCSVAVAYFLRCGMIARAAKATDLVLERLNRDHPGDDRDPSLRDYRVQDWLGRTASRCIIHGRVDCLVWLETRGYRFTSRDVCRAIKANKPIVVRWLMRKNIHLKSCAYLAAAYRVLHHKPATKFYWLHWLYARIPPVLIPEFQKMRIVLHSSVCQFPSIAEWFTHHGFPTYREAANDDAMVRYVGSDFSITASLINCDPIIV